MDLLLLAEDASQPNLAIRTVEDEPYAPRAEALSWSISATIPTRPGTFIVSHAVGHDARFVLGMYR